MSVVVCDVFVFLVVWVLFLSFCFVTREIFKQTLPFPVVDRHV